MNALNKHSLSLQSSNYLEEIPGFHQGRGDFTSVPNSASPVGLAQAGGGKSPLLTHLTQACAPRVHPQEETDSDALWTQVKLLYVSGLGDSVMQA